MGSKASTRRNSQEPLTGREGSYGLGLSEYGSAAQVMQDSAADKNTEQSLVVDI